MTSYNSFCTRGYVGLAIPDTVAAPYLQFVPAPAIANRSARNAQLHLTILTPKEYRSIKPVEIPYSFPIKLIGLGTASTPESTAWFIVCESEEVQAWRASLGLPPHDLHITLGFTNGDVFTLPKNRSSLLNS